MIQETIRDFRPDDLGRMATLWQISRPETEPVYNLSEVLASCQADTAVLACIGEDLVGAAVGRAAHEQGWVVFLGVAPAHRHRGVGARLLTALERRLAAQGLGTAYGREWTPCLIGLLLAVTLLEWWVYRRGY